MRGLPRGLQGLRQDDVIERVVGIVAKVGIGVALDHGQTLRDALVHALARQLDAAPVDIAALAQKPEQFAVAAADVEHLRPALDHLGDKNEVDARAAQRTRDAVGGHIDVGT